MARKPSKKPRSKSSTNSRKRGRGRPSDFLPEFCGQAEKLCKLLRAEDKDLAAFFEKDVATINRWKQRHPEFCEAIKRGKVFADLDIVDKLHERGLGYEWQETVPIKLKRIEYNEAGKKVREEEYVELVSVTKRQPADVTAGIFWLKNRAGWRDKVDHKHEGALDLNLNEVRGGIASKLDRIAAAIEKASVSR